MTSRRCPSCGHSYNGKRCKNCLYEPFGDVRPSFELHREEALPRREAPPIRPSAPPSRSGYPPRSRGRRKQSQAGKTIFKRLGTVWAVILLLTGLLPMLFEVMDNVGSSYMTATRETIPLPAEGTVLYEDADIQVIADWDGTPIDDNIPVFVRNFTGKNLTVCTDGVAVNGCMTDDVFFYCDAYRDSVTRADLWVEPDVLAEMGIQAGLYIQMNIDVMDEDYNMLVENASAALGDPYIQELNGSGDILYDQDHFLLVYKGMDEDQFGDPRLVFYAENNTERLLELSANELLINGEETGCWLWQNFLPGTKGIFYGRFHDYIIPKGNVLAETDLFLTPDGDWNQEIYLGPVNFQLN